MVEYQSYQEDAVLQEIHSYLETMTSIAQKANMNEFIIKSKLIQTQLASIEGNFELADKILESTLIITEERKLPFYTDQILRVKSDLDIDFEEMKKLRESNASFSQRLEKSNLLAYLQEAQGLAHQNN